MSGEPVLTAASVSAAIVAAASLFDVVLELSTIETIAVVLVPLVASLFGRSKVTPI